VDDNDDYHYEDDYYYALLMYKTAVYRLVNGGISHQKQQISGKGDTTQQTQYIA